MASAGERRWRRIAVLAAAAVLLPLRAVAEAVATGRCDPRPPRSRFALWGRLDLALAGNIALAGLIAVSGLAALHSGPSSPGAPPGIVPPILVLGVALFARNRWPLGAWRLAAASATLIFGLAAAQSQVTVEQIGFSISIGYLLCCYTAASRCTWRTSLGIWLCTSACAIALQHLVMGDGDGGFAPFAMIFTLAALLTGGNVRIRREAAAQQTARALAEERSRIARELHDVVAHHMSVVAIQAEAAPLRHADDRGGLQQELAQIRTTALQALAETRLILTVLRSEDSGGETAPQPGLDRVEELLVNARAAGHDVVLRTTGSPRGAPAGVELSAYRIIQESLSNVMRHAPGAPVEVELGYDSRELRIRVVNGPGRTPEPSLGASKGGPLPGRRHGLVGMRERAAMLSGTLDAQPRDGGGFEVTAVLPLAAR